MEEKSIPKPVFESMTKVMWYLMWKKERKTTIKFLVVIFLFVLIAFVLPSGSPNIFGLLAFSTLIIFLAYFGSKSRDLFMREFARVNNLKYESSGDIGSVKGRFFNIGNEKSRSIIRVLSGKYIGFPIRLFQFYFSVGQGRNKAYLTFTVCELTLEKTDFPFLLLQSKKMSRWHENDVFSRERDKDIEINLEPEFAKTFRLFTIQNYEIEALQIFTHEVLSFLKEQAPNLSIEFAGNKVSIFAEREIHRKKDLDQMYTVLKKMIDTTGHFLNRLHDDYQSMHEVYDKDRKSI